MSSNDNMLTWSSQSETETAALGAMLGAHLRPGDVVLLDGDLGMGKSVFARGLIRELATDAGDIPSPTFTLVQTYPLDARARMNERAGEVLLYHFDLYRLENPEEIWELAWEEAIADDALAVVEWPDRLGDYEPDRALHVTISASGEEGHRRLALTGNEDWTPRLAAMRRERG